MAAYLVLAKHLEVSTRAIKFLMLFTFSVTFTLTLIRFKSARDVIGIYHHTKFENDMLYTVDTTLLINRQTDTPSFQRDNRNNSIVFNRFLLLLI